MDHPPPPPTQTSLELNPRERFQMWKRKYVQAADIAFSAGVSQQCLLALFFSEGNFLLFGITPDKFAK
jgi:hypothetical protein